MIEEVNIEHKKGKIKMENNQLIAHLFNNTKYEIEEQDLGYGFQVAAWCESFGKSWSICFQDGDMNGNGGINWRNDGANVGVYELLEILEEREEFKHLIDDECNSRYRHSDLNDFIDEFILEICKKEKIKNLFNAY